MADTINEIRDPLSKGKLKSLQDHVTEVDAKILQFKSGIGSKRATAESYERAANHIMKLCNVVQRKIDEQGLSLDEGRAEIRGIKAAAELMRQLAKDAQEDLTKHIGKIAGLETGIQIAQKRFTDISMKYDRWERIQAEEEAQSVNEEKAPKPQPPAKKKAAKKSTARKKQPKKVASRKS